MNRTRLILALLFTLLILLGCSDDDDDGDGDLAESVEVQASPAIAPSVSPSVVLPERGDHSALVVGATWTWQLQGDLNTSYDVDIYDVDLFDTTAEQLAALRRDGRYVVCYFSAGSFEEWRADADEFPADGLGNNLDGWPGERWLDITNPGVREVMQRRIALAASKGCDGLEPDNVTAANNDTGFDIDHDDQLDFNRFLADTAHAEGLTIGLKNDLEQLTELVEWFDFAVNEECHDYDECGLYSVFLDAGKPVFNAEYADRFVDDPSLVCTPARTIGLSTVIYDVELDDSLRVSCD